MRQRHYGGYSNVAAERWRRQYGRYLVARHLETWDDDLVRRLGWRATLAAETITDARVSARSHRSRGAAMALDDHYCISSNLAIVQDICALVDGDPGVSFARLRVQESGRGRARIELGGEFDAGVITALRITLREVLSSADCLLIDPSRTTFLDALCVSELRRLEHRYPDRVSIVNRSWQAELSVEVCTTTDPTGATRGWS